MTLLFKIHYFLWYGAHTGIFGYESVYAKQYTNASMVQFGTLKMILPFIAVIVTPIICSMADRKRSHRLYFIISLLLTTITMLAYIILPLTMQPRSPDQTANSTTTTTGNNSSNNITLFSNVGKGQQHVDQSSYVWFGLILSRYEQKNLKLSSSLTVNITDKPHLDDNKSSRLLWLGPWIFFCINTLVFELVLAVNTCLSDSFAVLQAEESGTSFGRIILWGTFGWAISALLLSYINQFSGVARLLPGLMFSALCLIVDLLTVTVWPNVNDFKLDLVPIEVASSLTGSSSSGHREPSDYQPLNEANLINLGTELVMAAAAASAPSSSSSSYDTSTSNSLRRRLTKRPAELIAASDKMDTGQFNEPVVVVAPKSKDNSGQANKELASPKEPAKNLLDLNAFKAAKQLSSDANDNLPPDPYCTGPKTKEANNELLLRLPKQLAELESAAAATTTATTTLTTTSEINSQQQQQQSEQKDKQADSRSNAPSFKIQFKLFILILDRRRSLIRYLILFMLSGFFMSMQWNYFFLYLETILTERFALISALSMVGQSLLGELPFFILSRKFIDKLGRSHTLSVSLISIGVRFLIYRFLLAQVSIYCIFLADCLQGPNYGLFYVVMTEVGLEYSFCDEQTIGRLVASGLVDGNNKRQVDSIRLALRSTVQSVAFACYEGIGVGFGSLAGGLLLNYYDFNLLWLSMAIGAISIGAINIMIELLCREHDPED